MKLKDILLLELREYLDRNNYGYWIDTNQGNKLIPVNTQGGHEKILIDNYIDDWGISNEQLRYNPYIPAFEHGLVRVAHPQVWNVNISGYPQDIQKVRSIIAATIVQPDVDTISIDKYRRDGLLAGKEFNLPYEREKAIKFIS